MTYRPARPGRPDRPVRRRPAPAARTRHDRVIDLLKLLGAGVVLVAFAALIVLGVRAHQARARECKANGGHVTHVTTGTGEHSHTTYYCMTPDRGMIDVWG